MPIDINICNPIRVRRGTNLEVRRIQLCRKIPDMQPDPISSPNAEEDAVENAEWESAQRDEVVSTNVFGDIDAGVDADGDEDGGDDWGDDG